MSIHYTSYINYQCTISVLTIMSDIKEDFLIVSLNCILGIQSLIKLLFMIT